MNKPLKRVCLRFVSSLVYPDVEPCRVKPIREGLNKICRVIRSCEIGAGCDLTVVLCHDLSFDFVRQVVTDAEESHTPAIFMLRSVNESIPEALRRLIESSEITSIVGWMYLSELVHIVGAKLRELRESPAEPGLFDTLLGRDPVAAQQAA